MTNKEVATQKLQELIPIYSANKSEMDSYKKLVERDNKEIKQLMLDNGITEINVNGIKATVTIAEKYDFVEDRLLTKLKELGVKGVIKTRKYVDMDALESAIYNGQVSAAELNSCRDKKETVTLRVK